MLTPTHQVTGPARRFYSEHDSDRHLHTKVRPTKSSLQTAHGQGSLLCREPDGSTLWVPASNLQPLS